MLSIRPFFGFRYAWASLLLALTACSEPACVLLDTSFEDDKGWSGLPACLSTVRVHSGGSSYRIPDKTEYGAIFSAPLGTLCFGVPRQLHVSSWVYMNSGHVGSTLLLTQIDCHGRRPNVWERLQIDQIVPRYDKWEHVKKFIRLPSDLDPTDELKVTVWHADPNGDPTYFDDLRVEGQQ